MSPSRSSSAATVAGSWSMPSARSRISAATSASSASSPASRSAIGSNRGSRRATARTSRSATAADSRAPVPSASSASCAAAAPRAIASPCCAAASRPRISSASPGCSRAAAISAASCSSRSTRRASSRGSISSSASAARLARQRSTASAIADRAVPWPPNASSRSRCQRSSSSRCCSCWPWISTSGPTSSASREAVVATSSRRAVDRPPVVSSRTAISGSGRRSKRASTRADSEPCRIIPGSARAPHTSPSASMTQALAGAGLAGDDVEAWAEGHAEPVDQRQVADRQLEQASGAHDGSNATLRRSRSQNGSAPVGSISRMGRSIARTSITSPTSIFRSSRPSIETRAS